MFELRAMTTEDWPAVGRLIFESTNAWYVSNGRSPIFTGNPEDTQLFCQVYEDLDPGCCVLAIDRDGQIAGSCFYHPRPTHVSLGIMNVASRAFGQGIASRLLKFITDFSDRNNLPVRLVSSAVNLDSYSLYNRAGFVPRMIFQDMLLNVPADGIADESIDATGVRTAELSDVEPIVQLEQSLVGINRAKDFRYFIENKRGIWHVLVHETAGEIDGVMASVCHPASHMLGPGVGRSQRVILALLLSALNHYPGRQPVWLIPGDATEIIQSCYSWGARNCELHIAQSRGPFQEPIGIVMPSFMPETG